ncbi:MAG: NYN domain-containing protein, partial [Patescibacteria group bacterium]
MNGERKANVVVLLDGQNLFYTLYQNGRMFNPSEVKQVVDAWCKKRGFRGAKFVAAKYYTDATKDLHYITARRLDTANFEIIHCFTTEHEGSEPKSTVDQSLGKGMIWASGDYVDADMIVIGVGDRDLLQSIQAAIEYLDKEVVLLCTPYATSQNLKDFICEKYGQDHIITIYGEKRANGGKATAPTETASPWSEEQIKKDCRALFSKTTVGCISDLLPSLPDGLLEVIKHSLIRAYEAELYSELSGNKAGLKFIADTMLSPKEPFQHDPVFDKMNEESVYAILNTMSEYNLLVKVVDTKAQGTNYHVNCDHTFAVWVNDKEVLDKIGWEFQDLEDAKICFQQLFTAPTPEDVEKVASGLEQEELRVVIDVLCSVHDVVDEAISKGNMAGFGHICNVLFNPRPPYTHEPGLGQSHFFVALLLSEMISWGVLLKEQKEQRKFGYIDNVEHPFVEWVASAEPIKTGIISKLNSDEFKEILPKKEMFDLIEPIKKGLSTADEPD